MTSAAARASSSAPTARGSCVETCSSRSASSDPAPSAGNVRVRSRRAAPWWGMSFKALRASAAASARPPARSCHTAASR